MPIEEKPSACVWYRLSGYYCQWRMTVSDCVKKWSTLCDEWCFVIKEREKDVKELENQEISSLVWIAVAGHNCSEINVVDANSPGDVLDTFCVCSSRVLCIASVSGECCNTVATCDVAYCIGIRCLATADVTTQSLMHCNFAVTSHQVPWFSPKCLEINW